MMSVCCNAHPHLSANHTSNWHERGPHMTHFLSALSIFFPTGKRFSMDSACNRRHLVTDPGLK